MEESEDVKEFPDVDQKLAAPKKLSAFEKERQAAEAKRQRAEAENAAALKEFEDSFGSRDDDDDDPLSRYFGPPSGPRRSGPGFGARFGGPPRSGPGSLGPIPGPPPPSLKRKRALDEMREAQEARREQSMAVFEVAQPEVRGAFQDGTQEEIEDSAPKPTVRLASLPPTVAVDQVAQLLSDHLQVAKTDIHREQGPPIPMPDIQFLPPAGPGSTGRRSFSAIVTLEAATSAAQIDSAVTALKGKYLGCGFYLSISRHLSSAASLPNIALGGTGNPDAPFGAARPPDAGRPSLRNAPPPPEHGFPPPDVYARPYQSDVRLRNVSDLNVNVELPADMHTLRAVHAIADRILSQPSSDHALAMERQLMIRPEIQMDEKFSFLYESKSPASIYYRYLLWGLGDPDEAIRAQKAHARGPERIYEDADIVWADQQAKLRFLDLDSLAHAVDHIDYDSDEEESDEEGGERRFNGGRESEAAALGKGTEKVCLGPLKRARLIHLLSRLPTSNARLRKGDVARVTNFAITHAGSGADDIVDMLLLNVDMPFQFVSAAAYEADDAQQEAAEDEEDYEPTSDLPSFPTATVAPQVSDANKSDALDPSNAKLIALYLISDILSASSTAGARNAWKYRSLFEAGLCSRATFSRLGRLEKDLSWGRLKAEQWKRKVSAVFSIWEGWSVFRAEVLEQFRREFLEPPMTEKEVLMEKMERIKEDRRAREEKMKGKFRKVGGQDGEGGKDELAVEEERDDEPPSGAAPSATEGLPERSVAEREVHDDMATVGNLDGAPMDLDGAPLHLDGAPVDLDGAPVDLDADPAGNNTRASEDGKPQATEPASAVPQQTPAGPRRRMRAEDMFAESDED